MQKYTQTDRYPRHPAHHHRMRTHRCAPTGSDESMRGFMGGGRGMRGGGGGFRGGGRRRLFDSGELRLVLLSLIAQSPRHGYDLIRAIEERTGGAYAPSPGVVYPTITMLQDMSFIDEAAAEGARKAYAITEEGRAHLAGRQAEADALLERLDQLGQVARKTDGGPVKRAMLNLRTVLHARLGATDIGEDMLHDVAEIIDEAARRIERLKTGGAA